MLKKIPRAKVDKRDRTVRMTNEAERQKLEKEIDEIKAYLDSVCDYINGQDEAEAETIAELSTSVAELTEIVDEIKTDTYSTTEIKTNKIWKDGKPIYRKVIELGLIGNQTRMPNVLNCDTVVDFNGYILSPSGEKQPLNKTEPPNWRDISYKVINGSLDIVITRDSTGSWSNWYFTVIIEYTKPTSN